LENIHHQKNFASLNFITNKKLIMKTNLLKALCTFGVLSVAIVSCDKNDNDDYTPPPQTPQATVLSAAGDSAAIIGTVNQFRSILGDSLNTTPGKTTGRREINWDGVPSTLTNQDNFPFDFFNSTNPADPAGRKRGLVYVNSGNNFRVDSTSFAEIDASYANQFGIFSKKRLLVKPGSNVSEVVFKVAGTNTDAFVHGFGLIFSDVDNANSTTLEFFDGNNSLGIFKAPVRTGGGAFSFLGVNFPYEKVTRVKITSGSGVLSPGAKDISDGGSNDLVVMDDFFYTEPNSVQ
jgi:hypothetical protein